MALSAVMSRGIQSCGNKKQVEKTAAMRLLISGSTVRARVRPPMQSTTYCRMSTHCFDTDTLCELASGELELAVLKSVQLRAQFLWEIRSEHTDGVVRRAHGWAATLPKGAKLRRHKERQEHNFPEIHRATTKTQALTVAASFTQASDDGAFATPRKCPQSGLKMSGCQVSDRQARLMAADELAANWGRSASKGAQKFRRFHKARCDPASRAARPGSARSVPENLRH
jgi:hypothetical protein